MVHVTVRIPLPDPEFLLQLLTGITETGGLFSKMCRGFEDLMISKGNGLIGTVQNGGETFLLLPDVSALQ